MGKARATSFSPYISHAVWFEANFSRSFYYWSMMPYHNPRKAISFPQSCTRFRTRFGEQSLFWIVFRRKKTAKEFSFPLCTIESDQASVIIHSVHLNIQSLCSLWPFEITKSPGFSSAQMLTLFTKKRAENRTQTMQNIRWHDQFPTNPSIHNIYEELAYL